jgi:hypothetical protein
LRDDVRRESLAEAHDVVEGSSAALAEDLHTLEKFIEFVEEDFDMSDGGTTVQGWNELV